jgi:hypothetical protein
MVAKKLNPTHGIDLMPRSDFMKRIADGVDPTEIGMVKFGNVLVSKGPLDSATGMEDIDTIISTNDVDRDRDIMNQDGWDLDSYHKNPVVLWAHSHFDPPVAKSIKIGVSAKVLKSRDRFTPPDMNAFGHMIYRMVSGGFIKAKSVGFRILEYTIDNERGGWNLDSNELLEHSYVPVPANPHALVQASAAGIDLAPLKTWAAKVLDDDPEEHRVLCWLPREVVEKTWKDARAVTGDKTLTGMSGTRVTDLDHSDGTELRDTDAGGFVPILPLTPDQVLDFSTITTVGNRRTVTKTKTKEHDMDQELAKALSSLIEALTANTAKSSELLDVMKTKHEADTSVELKDVVRDAMAEVTASRSGRLPE